MGGILLGLLVLPVAPINSDLWSMADQVHELFRDQIGWQELTESVAGVFFRKFDV